MGEQKPYCGDEDWITLRCSTGQKGHDHQKLKHSCKRLHCPICWDERALDEAYNATERLDGISQAWKANGRDLLYPVKIMLSPPKYDMINKSMKDLRDQARKIIEQVGGVGGTMAWHPYRAKEKNWDLIRSKKIRGIPAGHFHGVSFMPEYPDEHLFDAKQIRKIHRETGWVVKIYSRIIKKGPQAGQYYNLPKHLHYELTHVGMDRDHQNAHTLTWFGICAYNNVKVNEIVTTEEHLCSVCGATVNQYRTSTYIIKPGKTVYSPMLDEWIVEEDIIETHECDCGPHMKKRIERYYQISAVQVERALRRYGPKMGSYTLHGQLSSIIAVI
jgi:hypothetical protein